VIAVFLNMLLCKNTQLFVRFMILCLVTTHLVAAPAKPIDKLKLVWVAHDASISLARVSKKYTELTGIEVEVIMLPYGPGWHSRIAAEFAAGGDGFDLAVWDSQSVAEFADGNHIELLNSYIENSSSLSLSDLDENSLKRYSEYPEGSKYIWTIPINQDAVGLMYRKDLFESPVERAKFQDRYGYPLALPKTYKELRDIAEFFTRPEEALYGWAQFAAQEYDFASSAANNFIWSYGGELWNHKTNEIVGYLDSPASVDGLTKYIEMFSYTPDKERSWGYLEISEAFKQGHLAMAMQWYVFFDEMDDTNKSKYATATGFANLPGAIGRDNLFRRQIMLGGQGIGINRYSTKRKQAWHFIEWFMQRTQQVEYTKTAKTALKSISQDPNWQTLNLENKSFSEALNHVNDYWRLPEYIKLLEIYQQEITSAIHGRKSPKLSLSMAARRQEIVLTKAGYKITRTTNIPEVPDKIVDPVGQKLKNISRAVNP